MNKIDFLNDGNLYKSDIFSFNLKVRYDIQTAQKLLKHELEMHYRQKKIFFSFLTEYIKTIKVKEKGGIYFAEEQGPNESIQVQLVFLDRFVDLNEVDGLLSLGLRFLNPVEFSNFCLEMSREGMLFPRQKPLIIASPDSSYSEYRSNEANELFASIPRLSFSKSHICFGKMSLYQAEKALLDKAINFGVLMTTVSDKYQKPYPKNSSAPRYFQGGFLFMIVYNVKMQILYL